MCFECAQGLSNEETLRQYTSNLEDPQFEKWNGTSLNFVMMDTLGYHGEEVQKVASQLLNGYYTWLFELFEGELPPGLSPEMIELMKGSQKAVLKGLEEEYRSIKDLDLPLHETREKITDILAKMYEPMEQAMEQAMNSSAEVNEQN